MKAKDSPLESFLRLGFSLQRLNRLAERDHGLSLTQWGLLRQLIDCPGVSAQALATRAGIHPSSLSQALARLTRARLAYVTSDPTDRRRKQVFITREGKEALDRLDRITSRWGAELAKAASAIDTVRVSAESLLR